MPTMLPPALLNDDAVPIVLFAFTIVAFQQGLAAMFETQCETHAAGRIIAGLLIFFQVGLFGISLLAQERRRHIPLCEREAPKSVKSTFSTHAMIASPNLMLHCWLGCEWDVIVWYAVAHGALAGYSVLWGLKTQAEDEKEREKDTLMGLQTDEKA